MERVDDWGLTRYIVENILYLKEGYLFLSYRERGMGPTSLEIEFPVLDDTVRVV